MADKCKDRELAAAWLAAHGWELGYDDLVRADGVPGAVFMGTRWELGQDRSAVFSVVMRAIKPIKYVTVTIEVPK